MISRTSMCRIAVTTGLMLGTVTLAKTPDESPSQGHRQMGTNDTAPIPNANNDRMAADADEIIKKQLHEIASAGADAPDKLFTLEAACGNMWEVEFSRVVAERSKDQQIKDLANQMINDHTEANRNLATVAQAQGVQLPTSLSSEKQAKLQVFRSMPVDQLESCYVGDLKVDHVKDVTHYAIHQKSAKNDQLKQYISQTLPKLREHNQHVSTVAQAKGITADTAMTDTSDMRHEVK